MLAARLAKLAQASRTLQAAHEKRAGLVGGALKAVGSAALKNPVNTALGGMMAVTGTQAAVGGARQNALKFRVASGAPTTL